MIARGKQRSLTARNKSDREEEATGFLAPGKLGGPFRAVGPSSAQRTLRRPFCLRGGQVFNQAGEEADQVRIGLDSDPLVDSVDPLQIVRRDARGKKR